MFGKKIKIFGLMSVLGVLHVGLQASRATSIPAAPGTSAQGATNNSGTTNNQSVWRKLSPQVDAIFGIGGAVAAIGIAYQIYKNFSNSSSAGYSNATSFELAAQNYADDAIRGRYNLLTGSQEYVQPDQYYYQDYQELLKEFVTNAISAAADLNPAEVVTFVNTWQTTSDLNYNDTLTQIGNALETGGTNAIGKWTVPDGYENQLDYLIKNNLTSAADVAGLYDYMQASRVGYLPSKYSLGDIPPAQGINMGGAGGTYSEAYSNATQSFAELKASYDNETAYSNALKVSYEAYSSGLAQVQASIQELKETNASEDELQDLQNQAQKYQANMDAANDAYKAANNEDIPGYETVPVEAA